MCEKLEQVACGMGHVVAMTTAGGLLRWGVEAGLERLDAELQALPLEGEQSGDNQLALLSVPKHGQQCPFGSAPARFWSHCLMVKVPQLGSGRF